MGFLKMKIFWPVGLAVLHLENASAKKCGRFNFIVLRGSDLNCFEKCGMNT